MVKCGGWCGVGDFCSDLGCCLEVVGLYVGYVICWFFLVGFGFYVGWCVMVLVGVGGGLGFVCFYDGIYG